MTGESLAPQLTDRVDNTYFDRLQKPLYGHRKTPLERRIDDARLSERERQILRSISAEYVVTLAALPPDAQDKHRAPLLDRLSCTLPDYYDNVSASLSRDNTGGELLILLGGQPLDFDELMIVYEAIPPSHEELNIREAEARIGTHGLLDRTRPEELPDFLYDEAHPGEGIIEWHEDDCLELTDPKDLHTGLSRELGRIGLRLVDTGKLLIQKIAS